MKNAGELLDAKGRDVWSVPRDASVFDAIQIMAEKEVGALVVFDGDRLVGVVSERDYARKVILKGRASKETQVQEIMSAPVICATGEMTVQECMAMMTEKRVRHLPVIDGDRILGVLSIGDLVKTIIADQRFVIEQLEHYISN